jgi:putative peptidoglycan lipid II flippase
MTRAGLPVPPAGDTEASGADPGGRAFIRSSGVIGGLTLVSRLAGFVREVLLARAYGTSTPGSAIVVAQNIPNVARSALSEDVAQGALVPLMAPEIAAGEAAAARRLAAASALAGTAILTVVAIALWFGAGGLVALTAPDQSAALHELAVEGLRILLPAVALNGVLASYSAYLAAAGRFGAVGLGPLLSNVPVLVALIVAPGLSVQAAMAAISGGYLLQAGYLAAVAARGRPPGAARASLEPFPWARLRQAGALAVPVMISLGMANLSGVVDVAFASVADHGGPAALDKAFRLVLVPYGVLAMSIGIVALPALARAAGRSRPAFDAELGRATWLQAALLLPVGVALALLAQDVIHLAYERGAFGPASTRLTTNALVGCAVALPAMGLTLVGTRAWTSRRRPWVPAAAASVGLLANAGLDAVLVGPLGLAGIGLATAAVHAVVGFGLIAAGAGDRRALGRAAAAFAFRLGALVAVAAGAGIGVAAAAGGAPDLVADGAGLVVGLAVLLLGARPAGVTQYREIAAAFVHQDEREPDDGPAGSGKGR